MQKLLVIALASLLIACTAEGQLKTLAKEFPQHKVEFDELKDLMMTLSGSGKDFRFLSSSATREKDDSIDFFEEAGRVSVSKALTTHFKSHSEKLLRVQAITHSAGIDYVSVDKGRKAVWVTLEGGGVLASDKGYLYAGNGDIDSFHLLRVLPIPNESNWFAFD